MGNVCSCLCPKRRQHKNPSYDVHEETFQMQQHIDSMNIDDNSPPISKNITIDDQIQSQTRQSMQNLIQKKKDETDNKKAIKSEQKYIQEKNKRSQNSEGVISEESVSFKIQQEDIHDDEGSLGESQKTPLIVKQEKMIQQNIQSQNNNNFDNLVQGSISQKAFRADQNDNQQFNKPQSQQSQSIQIQVPKTQQKKSNPNILKPKAIRKKYNPDDYRFKDESDSFKVKKIDSIKCQQYNIDNCNNCEYFIFDVTANVYIDDTNNCKIYIAPCQSTIFVRNCKNLTIIAATKQFRTVQCHNCVFSLLCKSQPVIESSSNLVFTPFLIEYYKQFNQQMKSVKIDYWNNHWTEIHNFTKKQGEIHHILKKDLDEENRLNWQKGFLQAQIQKQNPESAVRVPFIQGQYPLEFQKYSTLLVLFNQNQSQDDKIILENTQNYRILKSFKGKIGGFGKDQRVALLLAYVDQLPDQQKLSQIGQIFLEKSQIEKYQAQIFVNFGDQRQK